MILTATCGLTANVMGWMGGAWTCCVYKLTFLLVQIYLEGWWWGGYRGDDKNHVHRDLKIYLTVSNAEQINDFMSFTHPIFPTPSSLFRTMGIKFNTTQLI